MREGVDSFLNFMTVERGVSPNTLAAYKNDLYQLVDYLESRDQSYKNGNDWGLVDGQTLAAYLLKLMIGATQRRPGLEKLHRQSHSSTSCSKRG